MRDVSVDDSLAALKFIPDWFVTSEMIKKRFTALYAGERYSILMKILMMLYLMKWVLLILILTILIWIMIVMKMILILLFLSGFWPSILSLKNARKLKKGK